jgi:hypothetical protein
MGGWVGGWMDGRVDGWMDGRAVGWTDGYLKIRMNGCVSLGKKNT